MQNPNFALSLLVIGLLTSCSAKNSAVGTSRVKAVGSSPSGFREVSVPNESAVSPLTYRANAGGISEIRRNGHLLTTGGAYNSVLSCDGHDHQPTNGESRAGSGFFTTPAGDVPSCGRIPYSMSFRGTREIETVVKIGPLPSPTAIVSVSLDLNKSFFPDFEFVGASEDGWQEGCGYPRDNSWRSVSGKSRGRFATMTSRCFIDEVHPVAIAKRNATAGLKMRARGIQLGDVAREVRNVRVLDPQGREVSASKLGLAIQAAFYSHPGTNALAIELLPLVSSGRIPAGYSFEISEVVQVYDPTMLAPQVHPCGLLNAGNSLYRGEFIDSCDGSYRLWHQTDGNIVMYRIPQMQALWHTSSANQATSRLWMQTDGNLVLLNGRQNGALFHTGTYGNAGSYLRLQTDGNLVVYSADHRPLWHIK